jgi:hypothetical protein
MGFNLVSIPQLDKEGYTVSQELGRMQIKKDGKAVAIGHLREGLYQLGYSGHSATLASAYREPGLTEVDLLHRRLGHASGVYLSKYLKTKGNPKLSYCDACTMGKAGKLPYRKKPLTQHEDKIKALRFLSTVVGDLCGKLRIKSLSGTSYFAVLVDLASRYVWVLFLRKKSEFQDKYVDWVTHIRNATAGPRPPSTLTEVVNLSLTTSGACSRRMEPNTRRRALGRPTRTPLQKE